MAIEILCGSEFSKEELDEVDRMAARLGISRDEFIIRSVKSYSRECILKNQEN